MANGVFWLGQDGNVWVKGAQGTNSAGKIDANSGQYWTKQGYSMISDPNRNPGGGNVSGSLADDRGTGYGGQVDTGHNPAYAGGSVPSGSTSYSSGDGGAAARQAAQDAARRAANEAARNNTQKAIDSLGTELNTAYGNIDRESASIRSRYDNEAARNEADYKGETVNNNQSLLKNKQNSLQAGAQGARGLRSTLASIGALGGTGLQLANRAVTNSVNQDLGEASETAASNAMQLDKAINRFRDEDKDRRQELETQARNQRTAAEGRIESKRQNYFQKMADLFAAIDDSGNATSFLNRAGDLNQTIAQKTAVAATPFTRRAAAFTPGDLAEYLAGTGDMTVETTAGDATGLGTSPSSILAGRRGQGKDEKKKQSSPVFA